MLSSTFVKRIAESPVFDATRSPYLLVDSAFCIRAANRAYQEATRHDPAALLQRPMFEAFPPNPTDPADDGAAQLSASFELVFARASRHYMGAQRYDIPAADGGGAFVYKVWAPVNSPIHDDAGRVVAVLHHVEDLTPVMSPPASDRCGVDTSPVSASPVSPTGSWLQVITALQDIRTALAETRQKNENLQRALGTNRQIATAVGILMHAHNIPQHEAFRTLVRLSQHTNRKLRDIAAELITESNPNGEATDAAG